MVWEGHQWLYETVSFKESCVQFLRSHLRKSPPVLGGSPASSVLKNPPADAGDVVRKILVGKILWRRKWQPTPVFLPGKSHRQRNLVGYSPCGCRRIRYNSVIKQQALNWEDISVKVTPQLLAKTIDSQKHINTDIRTESSPASFYPITPTFSSSLSVWRKSSKELKAKHPLLMHLWSLVCLYQVCIRGGITFPFSWGTSLAVIINERLQPAFGKWWMVSIIQTADSPCVRLSLATVWRALGKQGWWAENQSHARSSASQSLYTQTQPLPSEQTAYALSRQSCLTLCDPMVCSPPGASVHGILQARIVEGVAMPFSRGFSRPRNRTRISCVSCTGRLVLYHYCHQL